MTHNELIRRYTNKSVDSEYTTISRLYRNGAISQYLTQDERILANPVGHAHDSARSYSSIIFVFFFYEDVCP